MSSEIPVYYASCPSYDRAALRAALKQVLTPQLDAFGGVRGKRIVLKPNLLAWRHPDDIACVHPAMVVETARLFVEAGAAVVSVMENPAVQTAPAIAEAMGILPELNELNVKVMNFSDYRPIPAVDGVRFQHIELAHEFLEFDAMVDLAKAKTHAMMSLTFCVKNLFGLVKGAERMGWHLAVGYQFDLFADMLLDLYLVTRPAFNVLDAVVCMEGNGPGSGTPAPRYFLAGSTDALALDASVSAGFGVDDLPILRRAAARGLLPDYVNRGDIPAPRPLELPPPPGLLNRWGCPLPPYLERFLRSFVIARPVLEPDRCVGCGLCAKMCPPQSLKIVDGKARFDLAYCIRCFCCQEHCPKGAIQSHKTFSMKLIGMVENGIRRIGATGTRFIRH